MVDNMGYYPVVQVSHVITACFCIILLLFGKQLLMGFCAKRIAVSKGQRGGFLWGFIFGAMGVLVVGFKHDEETFKTKQIGSHRTGEWKCTNCGEHNVNEALFCKRCGWKKFNKHNSRMCSSCNKPNDKDADYCVYCGNKMR